MARTPVTPNSTLTKILHLIEKDVVAVQKISKGKEPRWKTFTPEQADKLVKYAATLSRIIKDSRNQTVATKKKLQNLSSDELIKLLDKTDKK